jgi:hypothetical protein
VLDFLDGGLRGTFAVLRPDAHPVVVLDTTSSHAADAVPEDAPDSRQLPEQPDRRNRSIAPPNIQ